MARINKKEKRRRKQKQAIMAFYTYITAALGIFRLYFYVMARIRISRPQCVSNPNFYQSHIDKINRLIRGNDQDSHDQFRVNRRTFLRLCCLLQGVGLRDWDSRFVCLEKRVAIFLWILEHHTKQQRTKVEFVRSGEIVSRHFNVVPVLRRYNMLLVRPVPVHPNDRDSRWSWFTNC